MAHFQNEYEKAIEPLLFSLEDMFSNKPVSSYNLDQSLMWQWFLSLPLETKRHVVQIPFLHELIELLSIELSQAPLHFVSYSYISKSDLNILSKLGSTSSRFTHRDWFPLQRSRIYCEGLGIEFGLLAFQNRLLAGRQLGQALRRTSSLSSSSCVSLSSGLLNDFSLLTRLFSQASFGHFLSTPQTTATTPVWFNPKNFSIGEFICKEVERCIRVGYKSRCSSLVDDVQDKTNNHDDDQLKAVLGPAVRQYLLHTTTKSSMPATQLVDRDSNARWFPIGLCPNSLEWIVSQHLLAADKERATRLLLSEVDTEEAEERQRQKRSKKPPTQRPTSKKKGVGKSRDDVEKESDIVSPLCSTKKEEEVLPSPPLGSVPPVVVPVDVTASQEKVEEDLLISRNDLKDLLSAVHTLTEVVQRLVVSQERISQDLSRLQTAVLLLQTIPPSSLPLPLPLNNNNNLPTAVAATPPQPLPPPVLTSPPVVPPAVVDSKHKSQIVHPFFSQHNNATQNRFRNSAPPMYLPHYPSPPQPVFVRPHEWHGPNTTFYPPHHHGLSTTTTTTTTTPELMEDVPQLFEQGLLPVDQTCSMNLTKGINSFVEHCRVCRARREPLEQTVLGWMRNVVESVWPRARVKAFGSSVSFLSLPQSDLDLVVCLPKVTIMQDAIADGSLQGRDEGTSWQQKLVAALQHASWVEPDSLQRIQHAPMPVITFSTKPLERESLKLDVSFQSDVHLGLEANKLVVSLQTRHALLRPLVLVLKQFLVDRGLGKSFSGGLSSYALVIMVTCFLQASSRLHHDEETSVGVLLVCFLRFFGEQFDPRLIGISISRGFFERHGGAPSTSARTSVQTEHPHPPPPPTHHAQVRRRSFRIEDLNVAQAWQRNSRHETPLSPFQHFDQTVAVDHHQQQQQQQPPPANKFDPLLVEDPLQPGNNLGRNVFRIHQIQRACAETAKTLKNPGAWPLGSIIHSWRPQKGGGGSATTLLDRATTFKMTTRANSVA